MARKVAATAFVAILAACALLLVGPRSLGGPTTLISVDGTSMQPHYFTGDLAVFRRQSSYHVGEIAAERVQGSIVVHRLVAGNAQDGWRTKGDNRKTEDTWVVPNKDVLGSEWFVVHRRGPWLAQLTGTAGKIATLALMAALVVALPNGGSGKKRRAARNVFKETEMPRDLAHASWRPQTPRPWESTVLGCAVVVSAVTGAIGVLCLITSARTFGPLTVTEAAVVFLSVAGVAAVLATLLGARVQLAWRGGEVDRVVARAGKLLLRVERLPIAVDVVRVDHWEQLRDIAARGFSPVLHYVGTDHHDFAVMNQGTCYLFRLGEQHELSSFQQEPVTDSSIARQPTPIDQLRRPKVSL